MLSARSIALQGIGFAPHLMALQGLADTGVAPVVASAALGGSTIRRSGGKRRILPYIEPAAPDFEASEAIENIASEAITISAKRTRALRELEHLLLLH